MAYYPQIGNSLILTQAPYSASLDYGTVVKDMPTGMRYAYPLRGAGVTGYPTGPLWKFSVNYAGITDAEVNTLFTFFQSMKGRYSEFRFLDPGGNLLTQSEDFTNSAWTKSLSASTGATDPFGRTRACSISSGSMTCVAGPSDGGMSGFILNASVWIKLSVSGTVNIGFTDATTSTQYLATFACGTNWLRVSHQVVLPTNNQFVAYISSSQSASIFGAQVSPMKGEGAYVQTPGNYGYRQHVRFDTDTFNVRALGPNQSQVSLPLVEFWS
jgi:hypothetical protein